MHTHDLRNKFGSKYACMITINVTKFRSVHMHKPAHTTNLTYIWYTVRMSAHAYNLVQW